jgi:Helix-turn-helix domain
VPRGAGRGKTATRTARLPQFFDQTYDNVSMRKAYRCRAYPDEAQQQMLARTFGCVRVVWNRTLAARRARYADEGTGTSYAHTDRALTVLKKDPGLAFLTEVSCVPLQQALRHQHQAFGAFFAARARCPGFKSRAAAVHVVVAGHRCSRAGPGDGDRLPGAGRPLVRDLHRRHRRSYFAAADRG